MNRRLVVLLAGLIVVVGSPFAGAASPAADRAEARAFGDDPLTDVLAAAAAHQDCGLNRDQLSAAMLAPSWPETGAPANLSPSPMTLSRYDDAPGLWAFAGRSYPRAFWHPGVGLWQFDSAGLGAPFTASQRIDTRVIADEMARVISSRYCTATGTGAQRLAYAWTPWHACTGGDGRCLLIFAEIYDGNSRTLRNLDRIASVLSTGGMQQRTCRGGGVAGTFTCWRVDPSLAQGYNGFAQPGYSSRTPITAPFYVYQAGGREYRHWLRADTGYATGVWATRPIGQNARTSLAWHGGETLCDVTRGAGACCPALPVRYSCLAANVDGDYTPIPGDFNGDRIDDVLWYGPGRDRDFLWQGTIYGRFVGRSITVNGTYTPVAGDFDDDGRDDIFWYGPGSEAGDQVWYGRRDGSFAGRGVNVPSVYTPAAADFNGDGNDDVFWYGEGQARDYVWYGGNRTFTSRRFTQRGEGLVPLAADYDGDRRADVFWYGPGGIADEVWYGAAGRTFTSSRRTQIAGVFDPVVGRLNPGRRADILWYRPTADSDPLYFGRPGRRFEARVAAIDDAFESFAGDFNGDRVDDVFWYAPGAGPDSITLGG